MVQQAQNSSQRKWFEGLTQFWLGTFSSRFFLWGPISKILWEGSSILGEVSFGEKIDHFSTSLVLKTWICFKKKIWGLFKKFWKDLLIECNQSAFNGVEHFYLKAMGNIYIFQYRNHKKTWKNKNFSSFTWKFSVLYTFGK